MDLMRVKKVCEVHDPAEVNRLLQNEWKLNLITTIRQGLTFVLVKY